MRRTRVFFFTWLLSAVLAGPVFMGLAYVWGYGIALPLRGVLGNDHGTMLWLHYSERAFYALAVGPVAYISWRIVNKFIPHDEDEE